MTLSLTPVCIYIHTITVLILRKIYGPIKKMKTWRIRTNWELKELYKNNYIITDIKARRIRWLGHVRIIKTNQIN